MYDARGGEGGFAVSCQCSYINRYYRSSGDGHHYLGTIAKTLLRSVHTIPFDNQGSIHQNTYKEQYEAASWLKTKGLQSRAEKKI